MRSKLDKALFTRGKVRTPFRRANALALRAECADDLYAIECDAFKRAQAMAERVEQEESN